MHLTNYSVNKTSENYKEEPETMDQILCANDGSKRTLTALFEELQHMGVDTDKIKHNIKKSCQGIM